MAYFRLAAGEARGWGRRAPRRELVRAAQAILHGSLSRIGAFFAPSLATFPC